MDSDALARHLFDDTKNGFKIYKQILGNYAGPQSVGAGKHPDTGEIAIRVSVNGDVEIPSSIIIGNEEIKIFVANRNMQPIDPRHQSVSPDRPAAGSREDHISTSRHDAA
jgi:hypothetical protein